MRGRWLVFAAVAAGLLVWGMYTPSRPRSLYPIREPHPPAELGTAFDPTRCGSVRGSVHWAGEVPTVPRIERLEVKYPPEARPAVANPNAPHVKDGFTADVFVYLVGVDPRRSRPWNIPPVSVAVTKNELLVQQGGRAGRVGIVRRGESVDLVSREAAHHSIRGRGAAFFTQMLPELDRPVRRPLSDAGVVELSSGSRYYWLRGYLLVTDHPYAAVTGVDGAFTFTDVPDGEYEAVCWAANWHIDRLETDPEWPSPVRLFFRPAVEKRHRVALRAGEAVNLSFTLSAADFPR